MMKYENEEIIKRIEKASKNKKLLTHVTDKTQLSSEDKIKLSLCRHFVQFAVEKKLKLKDFAKLSHIPTTRLSEIMNYKISKFTVDKLIINLSILADKDTKIREYLILLEQVAEMPIMSVHETKKLTRSLREVSRTGHVVATV